MENNIQLFNNTEFGEVRILLDEIGNPWFVGRDVATALGYARPAKAIQDHVDKCDVKVLKYKAYSAAGQASALWQGNDYSDKKLINESGFYALAFRSELPNAKQFRHWVTFKVLPSIRKTGSYSLPQPQEDPDLLIAKALVLAQNKIAAQEATIAAQAQTINRQDRQMAQKENYIGIVENVADRKQEEIDKQKEVINEKQETIDSLTQYVPTVSKRNRIRQMIQKAGGDFSKSWRTLYREYELLRHINLQSRINSCQEKYDRLDYIEFVLHDMDFLHDLCVKLCKASFDKIVGEITGLNEGAPKQPLQIRRKYSRKK